MQNLTIDSHYLIQNLPIDQQFIIAQTLVSFFGISFAIFFGFAALSKSMDKKLHREFYFKADNIGKLLSFTHRFFYNLNIAIILQTILYLLSLIFFLVSLLSLIYFKLGNVKILIFALDLGIYSVVFAILIILFLIIKSIIRAFIFQKEEFKLILEYIKESKQESDKNFEHQP